MKLSEITNYKLQNTKQINLNESSLPKTKLNSDLKSDVFVRSNTVNFSGKQKIINNLWNIILSNKNLNYRMIYSNSRSACPTSLNLGNSYEKIFDAMVKNGTRVFIDVRKEGGTTSELKKAVDAYNKKLGKKLLSYEHFVINHENNLKSNIIIGDNETFLRNLSKLISKMNAGGCNVSCGGGQHRTDLFYCLSYIFNPQNTEVPLLSKALRINTDLNPGIYRKLLGKVKEQLFLNNGKQTFKYANIPGIRNISGKEFDKRLEEVLATKR